MSRQAKQITRIGKRSNRGQTLDNGGPEHLCPRNPARNRDILKTTFRKQFFRCFRKWYEDSRGNLNASLMYCAKKNNEIHCTISGFDRDRVRLCLYATQNVQLVVIKYFSVEGEHIDSGKYLESYTRKGRKGYYCLDRRILKNDFRYFDSRETLWNAYIFNRLADQINSVVKNVV